MSLEELEKEAIEINKFKSHCLKNTLQATLIIYGSLWKRLRKINKQIKKRLKKKIN